MSDEPSRSDRVLHVLREFPYVSLAEELVKAKDSIQKARADAIEWMLCADKLMRMVPDDRLSEYHEWRRGRNWDVSRGVGGRGAYGMGVQHAWAAVARMISDGTITVDTDGAMKISETMQWLSGRTDILEGLTDDKG